MKMPKLFLDSCNPSETSEAMKILGKLDGQTTNPTLLAKNPDVQKKIAEGKRMKESELLSLYQTAIREIESTIGNGAISVEVYADWDTKAQDMLRQAERMYGWGRNIYMKFPTIPEGLKAAREFTQNGGRVNMTLVFTQEQAAAVYSATRDTKDPAFVSPFLGRWDDRGVNGVDLVRNIVRMYRAFEKTRGVKPHVEVLAASVRTLDHFLSSVAADADIVTAPLSMYKAWVNGGKTLPDENFAAANPKLTPIPYHEIEYTDDFAVYPTDRSEDGLLHQGLVRFANDWNGVVER
jgi:transaldolase